MTSKEKEQMRARYAPQIQGFDQRFDELAATIKATIPFGSLENLDRSVASVKSYYRESFNKSTNATNALRILASYEQFLSTLCMVKDGYLSCELACDKIKDVAVDRWMDVVGYNVAKAFELVFWAAATATAWMSFVLVGLPLLIAFPPIGLAISFGTWSLMATCYDKGIKTCDEFKSTTRIDTAELHQTILIGFFKPASPDASLKANSNLGVLDSDSDSEDEKVVYPDLN